MDLEAPAEYALALLSDTDREIATRVINRLAAVSEGIKEIGSMLCEMSDEGREQLFEAFPPSSREIFKRIHRVGQGQLAAKTVFLRGRAGDLISRLPVREQEFVLENRIPVVTVDASGRVDQLMADPATMSSDQVRQVFRAAGLFVEIRTPAEQQAWLDEESRRAAAKENRKPSTYIERADYVVDHGKLFPKPHLCEDGITPRMLRKMTADMRG
jgi:hypothetical protein